jgi:radial spoke head protein 1
VGERHGVGKTLLPNKDYYHGGYFSGLRQGLGLYQVMKKGQSVASYDGEWLNGLRHGTGTCLYPDGSKYTGYFISQCFIICVTCFILFSQN